MGFSALFNQFQLFLAGKALDLSLTASRLSGRFILLGVNHLYRQTGACICASLTVVMGFLALVKVVCPACVKSTVGAFKNINIVHQPHLTYIIP